MAWKRRRAGSGAVVRATNGTVSKLHNVKVEVDGIAFDSKAEARRYRLLVLLQDQEQLRGLRVHPKYLLQEAFVDNEGQKVQAIHYEADFEYFDLEVERLVAEEVKGFVTDLFALKSKMFRKRYPEIEFRIIWAKVV